MVSSNAVNSRALNLFGGKIKSMVTYSHHIMTIFKDLIRYKKYF